jgi:hypothetical protein
MKLYVYYDDKEVMAYLRPIKNVEQRPCIEIETPENVKKTLKIAEKENNRIGESTEWTSSWVKCDGIESELFAQIIKAVIAEKNNQPTNQLPDPQSVKHNRGLGVTQSQLSQLKHKFEGKAAR